MEMKTYEKILELARQADKLRIELCAQHEWIADLDLQGAIKKLQAAANASEANIDELRTADVCTD